MSIILSSLPDGCENASARKFLQMEKDDLTYQDIIEMANLCRNCHYSQTGLMFFGIVPCGLDEAIAWLHESTIHVYDKSKLLADIILSRIQIGTNTIMNKVMLEVDEIPNSFHNALEYCNELYSIIKSPVKYSNSFGIIMKTTTIFCLCRIAVYYARNIKLIQQLFKFRLYFFKKTLRVMNPIGEELTNIGLVHIFYPIRVTVDYIQAINKIYLTSSEYSINKKIICIQKCLHYVEVAWKKARKELKWYLSIEKIPNTHDDGKFEYTLIKSLIINLESLTKHEGYLYALLGLGERTLRKKVMGRLAKFPSDCRTEIISSVPIKAYGFLFDKYVANTQINGKKIKCIFEGSKRDVLWMKYWLSAKQCSWCFIQTKKLRVCSGCSKHWYCSKHHQKLHWNSKHRFQCSRSLNS